MQVVTRSLALIALLGFGPAASAIPTGDVTGGGTYSDNVSSYDGWSTNAASGNGVDFWTLDGGAGDKLSINVSGDTAFGVSLFGGTVDDLFDVIGFSNNSGFSDLSYVAGNAPFFGPFGVLDLVLPSAGAYTIAVGGAGQGFGPGPFNYNMNVSRVPEASSMLLLLTGGLAAIGAGVSCRRPGDA